MSRKKQLSRILSLVLSLSMVIGMLPTTAWAAQKGEIPDIIEYKSMTLVNLMGGEWISRYDYARADNTFYEDAAVNLNVPSLLRIGFTIEKSQNVDLILYKLDESVVQKNEDDDDHAHLEYYFDPEADDFGASVPEDFLGEKIGYINGIRVTENIVDPDENAEFVEYNRITDEEWDAIVREAAMGERTAQPMKDIYAFGFKGEKLILPSGEAEAAMLASVEDDVAFMSLNVAPSSDGSVYDVGADSELKQVENVYDVEADTELKQVETAEPLTLLPISDVLYDPNPVSTFFGRRAARAGSEWAIENYVLWDGTVVKGGSVVKPDYEDGYYVIVMQPCMPEAAVYNSFLGFASTTEERPAFTMDGYCEPSNAFFEDWFSELKTSDGIMGPEIGNTDDPVNLLTGSFSWNYTDMALYGKDDLPFIRYYESTAADKNFGLGNGWTSNFTADLTVKKFYAEVHLAQDRTLYFDMDYDGEYRSCGDWTFCWNGNGYTLENTMTNTIYNFNEDEILESIVSLGKSSLIFTNDGEKITRVTNGEDSFTFSYNGDGNLSKVTDSVGRSIILDYDGDNLISVENTDADSLRYTYNSDGYLATVENFKDEIYVDNTYDADGRVIHQYAADIGTFDFSYDLEGRHNVCTGTDDYLLEIWYDELNRITKSRNAAGTKQFTYNDLNQFTSMTDREGNTTYYDHDAAGNISKITYADGTTEKFVYDVNRQVTSFTDRNGVTSSYTYNSQGRMTSAKDGRGNTTTYTYDLNGNMTSMTDAEGAKSAYTYDAKGNRTSATDAKGNKTTYEYDEQGRLIAQTTADGSKTEYEYTTAGKLVKITDADGSVKTYTVDGNGFNTSGSDWMGNLTAYERNTQNQITKVTDPLGNATTYGYDDRGNLVVTTDANSNKVSYTYDAAGRMLSMTDGEGNTWAYAYDNESRVTSVTDPLGGVASTAYDEVGRTSSTTDANGAATSYTYDGVGNTTAIKDALGKTTKYAYDANGNRTSMTNRLGDTWKYTYDANNRLVIKTDALGGVTTYVYDELGNVTKTVTPGQAETATEYDSMSRPVVVTNALGFGTQYKYNTLGRVTTITNPDGTSVTYTYNANGQVLTATNEMGGVVTYTYDANGRVTSTTDPMGGKTTQTYDGVGNVIAVTDPMGFVTGYTYNANSAIETVTDANGNKVSYAYDANGRVSAITDANGGVTSYHYDAAGQLTALTDAEGHTTSYTYDLLGRVTAMTDGRGNTWTYEYDSEGNQTQAADPLDYTSSRTYDALGRVVSETDRNGNVRTYTYDADGYMTTSTDPMGNVTSYAYDAMGQVTSVTSPMGHTTTYTYDAMGRITGTTDPMGHTITMLYDDLGRVVGTVDALGKTASRTYDANGNLLSVTDEKGNTVSYTYDLNNHLTAVTDAMGNTTQYGYDAVGNLLSQTDALGGITAQTFDANGNLTSVTDAEGNVTQYTYDLDNRCTSITDPNGGVIRAEYDANDNIVKATDAEGNVTSCVYNARNELVSYTDAEGYTFAYTYDGNGNVLSYTDGNGHTTQYIYDELDRTVGRVNAEGNPASMEYDADGRAIRYTDEEGAVTEYAYDADGRLVSVTNALGGVTAFEYDAMDHVTKATDAEGNATTYEYDAVGNVITSTNAKGVNTLYTYDANYNVVSVIDAAGVTAYTYDALDRITAITDRNGNTQFFTYDAIGRIVKVTDKNGNETQYTYDGNGNVIATTDALGTVARFEYNANDQLVKVDLNRVDTIAGTDTHEVTLYEYDGRNLLTKEINALGDGTVYTYDGVGNLVSKADADGYVTEYTYNALDLVAQINYNEGKQATFAYNKVGQLVRMDDWTGTNTFELDLLGRLKKATDHKGNVVEYTYDKVGNETSITYPNGEKALNTYDEVYNLSQVQDPEKGIYSYTYDDADRPVKQTYPNGWVETTTYDGEGNVLTITDVDPFQLYNKTPRLKYEYRYDAEGNMIYKFQRDGDAEENRKTYTNFTYDALNRLTGSVRELDIYPHTIETRTYQYDSLGNLIRETMPGQNNKTTTKTYTYNDLNQMVAKQECGYIQSITRINNFGYTYDKRGNLVKEEEICSPTTQGPKNITIAEYTYDETNRMVMGTNKQGEASLYTFNALGVRVGSEFILEDNTHGYTDFHCETPSVDVPATGPHGPEVVKTDYVIDYNRLNVDQRVLWKHEEGGYDFRYTYGIDKIQVKTTGEGSNWWGQKIRKCVNMNYVHTDPQGSVVDLTDEYGRVTARTDYSDWGDVRKYTDITVDRGFRILLPEITYAGHEYDDVLDQFYAKYRMYDAEGRRFTSVDPVKGSVIAPMSMVQYLYVKDNPLRWVDPLGLYYLDNSALFRMMQKYLDGDVQSATLDIVSANRYFRTENTALHNIAQALTGACLFAQNAPAGIFFEHEVRSAQEWGRVDIILQKPNTSHTMVQNYLFEIKPEGQYAEGLVQLQKYYRIFNCIGESYETDYDRVLETGYFIYHFLIWADSRYSAYMNLYHHGNGIITYEVDVEPKPNNREGYATHAISSRGFVNMITESQLKQQKQLYINKLTKVVDDFTNNLYGKPLSKMTTAEAVAAGVLTAGTVVVTIALASTVAEAAAVFLAGNPSAPIILETTGKGIIIKLVPVVEEAVEWISNAA